eukprot:616721_1
MPKYRKKRKYKEGGCKYKGRSSCSSSKCVNNCKDCKGWWACNCVDSASGGQVCEGKDAPSGVSSADETSYGDSFDDYDYSPISEWNDNYDDVNVGHSMLLDSDNNHNLHREMALGAIGLLVITCCLFACCIIVWSAFLYVFKQSDDNKRHSAPSYDVVPSDHSQV